MNAKITLFILLFFNFQSFGQIVSCSYAGSALDTTRCYVSKKYPVVPFGAEIKLENNEIIRHDATIKIFDMDNDCIPEIFSTNYSEIIIIDSKTGFTKLSFHTFSQINRGDAFSILDIDDDAIPEVIVAINEDLFNPEEVRSKLVCYDLKGSIRWISNEIYDVGNMINVNFNYLGLSDFNQDNIPEIYINNIIFNAFTGVKLADGGSNGIGGIFGAIPMAGQLDDDTSDLELAAGYTVYKVSIQNPNGISGNSMVATNIMVDNKYLDGYTSIVDINNDGQLDVIVIGFEGNGDFATLYVYTLKGGVSTLIAKTILYGNLPPVPLIGILDKSQKISILVSSPDKITAYNYNGTSSLKENWTIPIDDYLGRTSATMFDFNADNIQEIVIKDKYFLKFYNVNPLGFPTEIFKIPCSRSGNENFVTVADIDNSGHAKICSTCKNGPSIVFDHLTVFGSSEAIGWAPARGIWHQFNYNVLNVNDDGTIPQYMKNNATYKNGKYNNFYVQESLLDSIGMYRAKASNLRGEIKCVNYDIPSNTYSITFDIINAKYASKYAEKYLPVSFYNGNPQTVGTLVGTYYTKDEIYAGDSLLSLKFSVPALNITELYIVVNTLKSKIGMLVDSNYVQLECDYSDNIFKVSALPKFQKLDKKICKGDSLDFYGQNIKTAGIYYHKIANQNDCDSAVIQLNLDVNKVSTSTTNISACDSQQINGVIYKKTDTYQIQEINAIGCDSIVTINLTINKSNNTLFNFSSCDTFKWENKLYTQSGIYNIKAKNINGCDSVVSLNIKINKKDSIAIKKEICNGDSTLFLGKYYKNAINTSFSFTNQNGCDSVVAFQLRLLDSLKSIFKSTLCQGDSIKVENKYIKQSGVYNFRYKSNRGCDSIASYEVTVLPSFTSNQSYEICNGDSILIGTKYYSSKGIFNIKQKSKNGCDSTVTININILPTLLIKDTLIICEGDSILIFDTYKKVAGNYKNVFTATNGCDSTISTQLQISPFIRETSQIKLCAGDSIVINEKIVTQTGIYNDTIAINGTCKKIIKTNVEVTDAIYTSENLVLCPESILIIDGKTIDKPGTYVSTLTASSGCDSIYTAYVSQPTLPDPPKIEVNCKEATYTATYTPQSFWLHQWQDSSNNLSTVLKGGGLISLKIYTNEGCEKIYDYNMPEIPKLAEIPMLKDQVNKGVDAIKIGIDLNPQNWKIKWSPTELVNCDTCFNIEINTTKDTTINVVLTHNSGCSFEQHFKILRDNTAKIIIPNIIYLGSNTSNSTWAFKLPPDYTLNEINVFDRWGNKVYYASNTNIVAWDGTFKGQEVIPGVFLYQMKIIDPNGEISIKFGDFTVIK